MIYELVTLTGCIIIVFCLVCVKIWESRQIDIAEKQIEIMERLDRSIAQKDYELLSSNAGLSEFQINTIYHSLKKSGAWNLRAVKMKDGRIYFRKNDGMNGYFEIEEGKVGVVSLNHIIVMRNGDLLMSPYEDTETYNM